jgi:hypothetical protein
MSDEINASTLPSPYVSPLDDDEIYAIMKNKILHPQAYDEPKMKTMLVKSCYNRSTTVN